jgi:hypothetical protein
VTMNRDDPLSPDRNARCTPKPIGFNLLILLTCIVLMKMMYLTRHLFRTRIKSISLFISAENSDVGVL